MRITLLTAVPLGLSLSLTPPAVAASTEATPTPTPALPATPSVPVSPTPAVPSPAVPSPTEPVPATGSTSAESATGTIWPDAPDARVASSRKGPRGVHARSAYLVDETSRQVLWGRNAGTRRPIGSITKVMTAVVVLRSGGLDRRIRIRRADLGYAIARHGSTARLRPGDRFTARELLTAMLVPSGCDAASALANAYGPGRARFVRKMNRTARSLGLRSTHYNDPAGLPPSPGWSTARDLVALGRYAMRFPDFRAAVARDAYLSRATRTHGRNVWINTDTLLGDYPGLIGIKSGYTSEAGYSFLFAARRSGRTLIGAVLNSSRTRRTARFHDAARILDWGFGWK
ncbi:D-alanyl-D-alanine carboxypeptidase family protein [Actinomadura rupiterrae]|uniref:D-alanyl-D-alanine carboxypeptidase family protein n=1 Tax=Actinomadura rupiterrae TaxID=559627 RepID=UPI0020A5286A|nr:serine hydrolase [Actinomadura rupiterrae]MCP2340526.1 D-alanyl-D-alanine carboxypeptidase (penicillin-binding protein 5/6) [Actinomadura rupiterrae]